MLDGFSLLRPLLHSLPPECAHNVGLWALRSGLVSAAALPPLPRLQASVLDLNFPHPLGLAAGFDKNAAAVDALLAQGFGFVEAGTVTPKAQPGNARPRLFRLPEDAAVINRLGFNNGGLEHFLQNFRAHDKRKGIAGANIGKNKEGDALEDYVTALKAVFAYADYITVNISSPNTQGLRDLQQRDALEALLKALLAARRECMQATQRRVPLLLKVAPDLMPQEIEDIAQITLAQGIDGLIVSNTTLSRPDTLRSAHRGEAGGLSGKPLFALSTACLKQFYRATGGQMPLVGAGGIASAADAYAKIRAGATLLQLYTALVYQGFFAVRRIAIGLDKLLENDGFNHLQQAVGVDAKA